MADQNRHLGETIPPHPDTGSLSETYVEVNMEDVGGYNGSVDSPEKEVTHTAITTGALSPVSLATPEGFQGTTDQMARRDSQSRGINYPDLSKAPSFPKHGPTPENEQYSAERFPPIPATEDRGKGRAPPTTLSKSELALEESKNVTAQLQKQHNQADQMVSQLETQLIKSTTNLSRLENQLYHNNNTLAETEAKLQSSRSECKNLRMKLEDATEDLKQTQEHVFRLQPRQQGITQSDALVSYTAICDSVQSWIGFNLDRALDEGRIDLGNLDMTSASKLIKLLNQAGLRGLKFAETDEYNIIAIVMEFLRFEVFENEFYGAGEVKDLECIRMILKNMEGLIPPRDLESRRSWRSETLGAMVHSADFDRRRRKRIQDLSTDLLHILGVVDGAIHNEKCFESLQRNIIEPSVNLAQQLHLSMDRFRVQWSTGQQVSPSGRSRGPSILEKYDCSNVLANGKPVRFEGKEKISGDGVMYLFDIIPGFYCQSFKDDTASDLKVMKKPKVLVAVAKPGRRASIPLAGKDGTILGSVFDRLHVLAS